jgi:hypothetical protein
MEEVVQGWKDVTLTIPKVYPRDDQAKTEEKEMTADSGWVNIEEIAILVTCNR